MPGQNQRDSAIRSARIPFIPMRCPVLSKDKVWQEMSKMDIFGSGSGLPHFCLTRVFRPYTPCYSGYSCDRSAFAPVDVSKGSKGSNTLGC